MSWQRHMKLSRSKVSTSTSKGSKPQGGDIVVELLVSGRFDPIKLGGIGAKIGNELEEQYGMETRVTVL